MPSSSASSSSKTVVVVGFGPAAVPAVQTLAAQLPADYRLVVITATEGYWPPSSLRAAVVPTWETKPVAAAEGAFLQTKNRFLLQGTQVVELWEHSVIIDKPHAELGSEIAFDYCILATVRPRSSLLTQPSLTHPHNSQGSKYAYPCRPRIGATVAQATADLRQTQQEVAAAQSILIVGGGPVGVELAGEIGEYYAGKSGRPKKRVTLVHSHDKFLHEAGWSDKFNRGLKTQVEALGTRVILSAKVVDAPDRSGPVAGGPRTFHLDNGETVEADFVFVAFGSTPNTGFVGEFDPQALNEKKQVKVRPSFQVEGHDHLFAIGDITSVPETKLVAHAKVRLFPTRAASCVHRAPSPDARLRARRTTAPSQQPTSSPSSAPAPTAPRRAPSRTSPARRSCSSASAPRADPGSSLAGPSGCVRLPSSRVCSCMH